jgi:hypothetical protein
LTKLDRLGIIKRITWATVEGISPQLSAYNNFLKTTSNNFDFVAFFDADEFLVPLKSQQLKDILTRYPDDAGAIAVNQRVFGSSGQKEFAPGLVVERFTQSSEKSYAENRFYKTICRPSYVSSIKDAHFVELKKGHYIYDNGTSLATDAKHHGMALSVVAENLQLNHYILKSWEEFNFKRTKGGGQADSLAQRLARYQSDAFFYGREPNINRVKDDDILPLVDRLRQEVSKNLALLA